MNDFFALLLVLLFGLVVLAAAAGPLFLIAWGIGFILFGPPVDPRWPVRSGGGNDPPKNRPPKPPPPPPPPPKKLEPEKIVVSFDDRELARLRNAGRVRPYPEEDPTP